MNDNERRRDMLKTMVDGLPDWVVASDEFRQIAVRLTALAFSTEPLPDEHIEPKAEQEPPKAEQIVTETEQTAPETSGSTRKGGRKSDIDTGKLLALHNAGWSNMKIAGELGIHNTTVSYHLRKLKEANKEEANEAEHQRDD